MTTLSSCLSRGRLSVLLLSSKRLLGLGVLSPGTRQGHQSQIPGLKLITQDVASRQHLGQNLPRFPVPFLPGGLEPGPETCRWALEMGMSGRVKGNPTVRVTSAVLGGVSLKWFLRSSWQWLVRCLLPQGHCVLIPRLWHTKSPK